MSMFLLLLFCVSVNSESIIGSSCQLKSGKPGVCRLPSECKEAREQIKKGEIPKTCAFEGSSIVVCCSIKQPGEISRQKCEEFSKYVDNGTTCDPGIGLFAGRKEFPHMVALGYHIRSSLDYKWRCNGVIISEMYILTAASCVDYYEENARNDYDFVRVSGVLLGVTSFNDTDQKQIIQSQNEIWHPLFRKGYLAHDIALLRLKEPIQFSAYARPACLHTENNFFADQLIFSGWNRLNVNESLHKLTLKYNDEFSKILPDNIREDLKFCSFKSNKESHCQGNGGGPLQIKHDGSKCIYKIVGVVPFGRKCGTFPSFYTNIFNYLEWIEKTVWPEAL